MFWGRGLGDDNNVCVGVCDRKKPYVLRLYKVALLRERKHIQIITDHPFTLKGSEFNLQVKHTLKPTHTHTLQSSSSDMN